MRLEHVLQLTRDLVIYVAAKHRKNPPTLRISGISGISYPAGKNLTLSTVAFRTSQANHSRRFPIQIIPSPMEPPGRCKRNDGQKWRCSETAAEGKSYCQKHYDQKRNNAMKKKTKTGKSDGNSGSDNLTKNRRSKEVKHPKFKLFFSFGIFKI